MSKIWYDKITGHPAVFDDSANISDWPNFQANQVTANATMVRAERDARLAASDDKVWPDYIPDDWRTYRQSLRDVPAQSGFPTNVTWPSEPT